MAVLMGCDYAPRNTGLGVYAAARTIQHHGSLEKFAKHVEAQRKRGEAVPKSHTPELFTALRKAREIFLDTKGVEPLQHDFGGIQLWKVAKELKALGVTREVILGGEHGLEPRNPKTLRTRSEEEADSDEEGSAVEYAEKPKGEKRPKRARWGTETLFDKTRTHAMERLRAKMRDLEVIAKGAQRYVSEVSFLDAVQGAPQEPLLFANPELGLATLLKHRKCEALLEDHLPLAPKELQKKMPQRHHMHDKTKAFLI